MFVINKISYSKHRRGSYARVAHRRSNLDSQLQNGNLTAIKDLVEQVIRPRTDNYNLSGQTLKLWAENMGSMTEFLRQPHADIKHFQLSKVKTLVDRAYNNVPFYRELYGACGYEEGAISCFSDFEQLPIVTKLF